MPRSSEIMRDWLTIELVLATLLVTSYTCVGLLALWAATSPRHWFVRTSAILAVLSPLLLRPMYEPFLTLTVQAALVGFGVGTYSRRAVLWNTLRGHRPFVFPRFSMRFMFGAICLVAIATAVVVAATTRLGSTFWITPVSWGVVAGLITLLAAWLTRLRWSWTTLLILAVAPGLLSYAYQESDYVESLKPDVNFWPHTWRYSPILPAVVRYVRALAYVTIIVVIQSGFLLSWRRWLSPEGGDRRPCTAPRVAIIAAILLLATFPAYMVTKLQFPSDIPEVASFPGDDVKFGNLLAKAKDFVGTALWRELCANQVNMQKVAVAAKNQAHDFDELHRILEQPLLRPVTVDWIAKSSTFADTGGWRQTMDENSQLSVLAQVLAARSEAARAEENTATAVDSALDLLRVAECTSRAVDFSTHLRADAFEGMAFGEIHRLLPFMNGSQCEAVIQRLIETDNRREPISKLLRYHRAQSENEFGWYGHFTVILGDIVNRLDVSLDANYTQFLEDLDRMSQAKVRLLVTELSLRRHFLSTNEYPVTLEHLSATDMSKWFADPFASNHEAFVYRRQNGGYVLYSLGVDRDNDGGQPPETDQYGRSDWRGDGDLRLDL